MSFLSRKPTRPGSRGSDAGRDDEYDDYDGYAHDAYQNEDDSWSPNQYFSPEGIKGRWAGEQPEGRAGGRGRAVNGRGEPGPGYDSYTDDYSGPEYGGGPGYGADEFATGVYDLPDGADEDRSDRTRRRRKDREDRGERTGILRLRRDRGEDIWPDDGISDEDYWASVAADRPLNGTDSPPGNLQGPGGANGRPGADSRPRTDARPGMTDARPGMSGTDSRFGGEQRGGERGATGRLGPPPGLAGDYNPGTSRNSGPMGSGPMASGQPGGNGRTGSGPMPARQGTGPQAARPGTGPTPTVGVTSSRPLTGQNGTRPGPAQPGPGPNGFPQPAARPSFQPNGQTAGQAGGQAGGRPQDRGDWGDRTERIDRVNASGYPDPRPSGRSQAPGGPRASGPLGRAAGYGPGPSGPSGYSAPQGRGRGDSVRPDNGRPDNAAWQPPDRREPDRRDRGRETSGAWPAHARGGSHSRGGAEDDPLTSKAYSRSAQAETDGRSYRVAARRSQAQTQLTEQAETFITGQYQQASQYQAGRNGEHWYRDDAPTTMTQATAARYPAPGGQGQGGQGSQGPGNHGGHAAQPGRSQASAGHSQGQALGGQPGQPNRSGGRTAPGQPPAGLPSGQYDAQQPRPNQQQRQQPQHRQPSQAQLPSAGHPGAGLPAASLPPAGAPNGGHAGGVPAGPRPTGAGGQNPYDSGANASYPYPSQSYAARTAATGPVQDGADDRYRRPSPADGHGAGGTSQGRADQDRNGYGYPATGDRRY
jgi:hypothetical protein